jgi:hypothetical protein
MIRYESLRTHPAAFRSLTGHSKDDFDALFCQFHAAHRLRRHDARTACRKRAAGAGRRAACSPETQLLLTLVWLRVYPTFALLGFFFGLHESNAWRTVQQVLATLETLADFTFERPAKERKALGSARAVMDAFPDVALVIDAKEQRLRRPTSDTSDKDNDRQKPFYSGKKKAHTLKNQIAVEPDGRIGALSDSVPGGANHDLSLLRTSRLLDNLAEGEAGMLDKGYDGITKDYPNTPLYLPHKENKARRNHPLTAEQKAYNRHLSSYRIVVEHTNAQLNQFQCLSQVFRSQPARHGRTIRVVGALVNRRIAQRPLKRYESPLALVPVASRVAA